MNAKDLMIGDWLIPYGKTEPSKIESLGYQYDMAGRYDKLSFECEPFTFTYPSYCKPVPLTREILIKNGFTHYEAGVFNDSFYFFAKDGEREGSLIRVWLYDKPIGGVKILTKIETESTKGVGVNEVHNCDIEFVHELQHALRLCRIDKEIEL